MKQTLNTVLPPTIQTKFCFTSTKLPSKFSTKDKTKPEHTHNIVYMTNCPDENCPSTYIGETARRLDESRKDHAGRDKNSHVSKHSIETGHSTITIDNFTILGRNFQNNWERKIQEALLIRKHNPTLNIQDKSIENKLLN